MRRWFLTALILVLVLFPPIGCRPPEPTVAVLPPGTEAITYNDPATNLQGSAAAESTNTSVSLDVGQGNGIMGMAIEVLDVGIKVRVVSDPGPSTGTEAEPARPVQVRVLEGPHAGRVGTIGREHLRPITGP